MTNISALGGAVTRLGPAVMGAVGAFLSLRAAMDAMSTVVSRGFDFNRTMETSKLGIASILSATNELITAEGRRLQGVDKLNAAQSVSRDLMKDIQIMGLQTTATTKDLVEGFQMVLGPAGQAGLNLDQTKQTLVGIVQAFGALGIPLEQLSAEARSLFDGDIKLGQDRLAGFLGITKELVLEWQRQGVYVEKLNEKLEAFRTAGDATAQTWEGLTSNLAEAFDVLAGHATEGLFEDAKKATSEILGLLIDTKNLGLGQDIQNIAAAIRG
ncbi:phage tail protein, partial [Desulfovibrio sulfodismutans]|nr:phage tail protein [Desulfolutivibrio sulfodismutans]